MSNKQEFDYVILIPGRSFSTDFLVSMIDTINFLTLNQYRYFVSIKTYPIISSLRNLLIGQNLVNGKKEVTNSSTLVFDNKVKINKKILLFDSDMCWSVDDLRLLIENDNKITVGGYQLVNGNTSLKSIKNKFISPKEFSLLDKPFEVAGAGLGFAAIDQEVFENIKYPWFEIDEGENFDSAIGEDIDFFKKATNFGYKIICDPRIKLGHVKQKTLYI
jgi:hypothetical protein